MSAIYALYPDGDAAQRAVNGLRQAGLSDSAITVISDQPLEAYECGDIDKETRIWYIASIGGFLGLAGSTWLTRMTELAWPLRTGNMPIVSWWPNLIVMFEMTMLGAIVATFGWFLWESGLVRKRDRSAPVPAPVPAPVAAHEGDPGSLCLRVRCRGDEAAQAIDGMRSAGAIDVQRRGEAL